MYRACVLWEEPTADLLCSGPELLKDWQSGGSRAMKVLPGHGVDPCPYPKANTVRQDGVWIRGGAVGPGGQMGTVLSRRTWVFISC